MAYLRSAMSANCNEPDKFRTLAVCDTNVVIFMHVVTRLRMLKDCEPDDECQSHQKCPAGATASSCTADSGRFILPPLPAAPWPGGKPRRGAHASPSGTRKLSSDKMRASIVAALLLSAACLAQAGSFDWLKTLDRSAHDLHLAAVEVGLIGVHQFCKQESAIRRLVCVTIHWTICLNRVEVCRLLLALLSKTGCTPMERTMRPKRRCGPV